jgi:hypothetical protein
MTDILQLLKGVRKTGDGWTAYCPAHDDQHHSLSIHHKDGKWLLKCHAGCEVQEITASIGMTISNLFDAKKGKQGRETVHPTDNRATAQPGLTLEQYATAKQLPVEFLRGCGLSDVTYETRPAVRIPYLGIGGEPLSVRFRISLHGDRFRWKSGSKLHLYGLNRVAQARDAGQVVLVEGESDVQTLWHHGIPALGIPGAGNWREDRDAQHLDGIEKIYIVIEPDQGGEAIKKWLSQSAIRHRALLVTLPAKDSSALHLDSEAAFVKRWQVALLGAVPWSAIEEKESAEERSEAWNDCSELAQSRSILDLLDTELTKLGMVGERRCAKLVYLATTSRLLDRPVSIAVKGPSSGGKSFTVETTLKLFPSSAFYAVTAMSERALAYSDEPLRHRTLVIYEAAGMASDFSSYLIRSLLSEGRLRYETVEKTQKGLVSKVIEREGPTGLITTTTALRLHPENETRLLSLVVTDTREQTKAVFEALADNRRVEVDVGRWQALQIWLAAGSAQVFVPFAQGLAELVPPVAVRLRRDFKTVLTLIRAHALLHQASRRKDDLGRIIATTEDYCVVRELVEDLVAAGVEATVRPEVRETVQAVADLLAKGADEVRQTQLRDRLRLDKSAISRRVADALDRGYLRNLEDRKGRPARLVIGDPLPDELEVLPRPERLHACAVDRGDKDLSPSPSCCHCGQQARAEDPLLEAADGQNGFEWVHRGCLETWEAAA